MRELLGKVRAKINRVFGISVARTYLYSTIGRELLPIDRIDTLGSVGCWGEAMFCSGLTGEMFIYCRAYLDARGSTSFIGHTQSGETSRLRKMPVRQAIAGGNLRNLRRGSRCFHLGARFKANNSLWVDRLQPSRGIESGCDRRR